MEGFFTAPSNSLRPAPPTPLSFLAIEVGQCATGPQYNPEDSLPSDLELSFASTMSLNSPPWGPTKLVDDLVNEDVVPMDISPAPSRLIHQARRSRGNFLEKVVRPRASTSAARLFGRDLSNDFSSIPPVASHLEYGATCDKDLGFPSQWEHSTGSTQMQSPSPSSIVSLHAISAPDAMDIDKSFTDGLTLHSKADSFPLPPFTTAAGTETHRNIFNDPSEGRQDDLPTYQTKKRRSVSPEPTPEPVHGRRRAGTIGVFDGSSPITDSSPSVLKLERIANCAKKPMLGGLGVPSNNHSKRLDKPNLSAMVLPSSASRFVLPQPPSTLHDEECIHATQVQNIGLPPQRRAFSAMMPLPEHGARLSGDSSFECGGGSSPDPPYAKRQQVRTIRRRDGTDDFRSLTSATAMVKRDKESPRTRMIPEWGIGLGGFGDNEAHGKILPCHRVREDGLMRINCDTLNDLLDGAFKSQIMSYHVIDCRFDYEYSGGHVPGAININTTMQLEEYFLGATSNKPTPSVSGEGGPKHVVVFHCEFSAKRAPTFAKHLRSRDRAINNHNYPRVHFPEVYILEGGYCQYFKESRSRCQPPGYIRMDDPHHAASRKEDLDQFRKAKFGRTKSYAYGDGMGIGASKAQKRNTPAAQTAQLFAAGSAARSRYVTSNNGLGMVPEDSFILPSEDEETDIGDSPCPPPSKNAGLKAKKLGLGGTRGPLIRAETYGPTRFESRR
ncbi:hypothetical protein B0F90DRAFT_1653306 [Multifurca ochricompacta]|uniref:M-phase inducer phosphatase n=1 Tax=Multifurca ochricompacta TaxID=376703 RepID=A0AAD4LV25_9AGAM|nr:hypothetical protein B0F90DRAFT_1653306 [Multifurca ochricompacta]